MTGTKGILWTLGLVFVVAALSAFVDLGGSVFGVDGDGLKTIIDAGIAAVAAFVINWLSPNVTRYGIGSEAE
jgi:hypothetical protein